jgi:hypothetical protein
MIHDRQQAVRKAQQQQQQQQMLHSTCSSHALTLQTSAASTEGLAAWQARGLQATALLPAAMFDGGSPFAGPQQQGMRHSNDGVLTAAADHPGTLSNSSSSSGAQSVHYSGHVLLSGKPERQGSPGVCGHQKYQIVTEPLVFGQPGRKQQQRQLRQQQERPQRHSRLQESHLEPSVYIESL